MDETPPNNRQRSGDEQFPQGRQPGGGRRSPKGQRLSRGKHASREKQPPEGRRPAHLEAESGQILLLVTGFVVLAILLVLVTVDVTALHLQRQALQAAADGAARDAADALDEATFYEHGAQERPVALTDASVQESVRDYLSQAPESLVELQIGVGGPTGALDEATAEVTLTGRARVPLVAVVVRRWASGVPLESTSRASAQEEP
ncbi:pilus assembly protein TadG-related protein [Kineosporia babensis]|nr:pilus assembly protein TadG-related protein [Kineosporia babensis]